MCKEEGQSTYGEEGFHRSRAGPPRRIKMARNADLYAGATLEEVDFIFVPTVLLESHSKMIRKSFGCAKLC